MGLIWSGRKPQNIKILNQDHIFSARSERGDTDFFCVFLFFVSVIFFSFVFLINEDSCL